jgi:HD-GYP domain-containing protein (c-di-GMP phosphodiesterase class II)
MERNREITVSLFDIVFSIASIMNLVVPEIVIHSQRVAYISYAIAKEMGLSWDKIYDITLAGLLHDSGFLSIKDLSLVKNFDFELFFPNPHYHAFITYNLLKDFKYLKRPAEFLKYHHIIWDYGRGEEFKGEKVSIESHIIHLADKIDVLIRDDEHILNQVGRIVNIIKENSGKIFNPYVVSAFYNLIDKEYFWLDISSNYIPNIIIKKLYKVDKSLEINEFESLSEILARTIDFRSQFTSVHSRTVAKVSENMGKLLGFSEREQKFLKIAGLLHDIGKLSIPLEILEKKGTLNKNEWVILRSHPYNTHRVLENLRGLEIIRDWSSYHHERLDGNGYPFHIKNDEIPIGAQIISISDIFTALSEDRPYRKGISLKDILKIMENDAKSGGIDISLFKKFKDSIDHFYKEVKIIIQSSIEEYEDFKKSLIIHPPN